MGRSIFNSVKVQAPKRSKFDMSHDVKMTLNMGELVPFFNEEVLPGDNWRISTQQLMRMMPMIAPVMHKVDVFVHFYYVPYRILNDNFEKFISAGNDVAKPATPRFEDFTVAIGSLSDYLGLPPTDGVVNTSIDQVTAWHHAAYQMIWDQYYRDQNLVATPWPEGVKLQDGVQTTVPPGSDLGEWGKLRKRAWQHDYFTSCLPWPQKGSAVTIPVGEFGDIPVYSQQVGGLPGVPGPLVMHTTDGFLGSDPPGPYDQRLSAAQGGGGLTTSFGVTLDDGLGNDHPIAPTNLWAQTRDLIANAVTINSLRVAVAVQHWLERNALGGTRFNEFIKSHWNVDTGDARVNRPEYIGGAHNNMIISEVLQTSQSDETPQANMAGHGMSVGVNKGFNYYAREYGVIMGIMSVMPKTGYQQGIHRKFNRFDNLDYATPEFGHLGEQPVLNREIYYATNDPDPAFGNDATFGYQSRYAEYKCCFNRAAGDMRGNLSYWQMNSIYPSRPLLTQGFVESDPTRRIFAVEDPDSDTLISHVLIQAEVSRQLPKYGTPSLMG